MDWIKMRVALERDPKTIKLKKTLAADADFRASPFGSVPPIALAKFVVGCLLGVWGVVIEHIEDGDVCRGLDVDDLDEMAGGVPGFGRAMLAAPWAVTTGDGVLFPNFREFNSPAKDRNQDRVALSGAERQRRYKARVTTGDGEVTKSDGAGDERVTDGDGEVTSLGDEKVTPEKRREEERREEKREKNPPYPPQKKAIGPKSPEIRLSMEWLLRRPVHTEHDRKADSYFRDVLKAGVSEDAILAAIKDAEREEMEPIWTFCDRLKPKARDPARKGDPMSSTKKFLSGETS